MTVDFEKGLTLLIADEDEAALESLARALENLGHEVLSFVVSTAAACDLIDREDPDVSIVMLHRDDEHALALISEIVERCSGPVIARVGDDDVQFVARAAERGIAACVTSDEPHHLQGAIEVSLRRHRERDEMQDKVRQLQTALERRTVIERAKGILMERHGLDDLKAFELLREHARSQRRRVVAVSQDVIDGTALLPRG
jgi:AmiR/NasT family two-component response regulator